MINASYFYILIFYVHISVFLLFANITLIKAVLICEIINLKFKTPYWIMWHSGVGNFAHTVDCLKYWLPTVFTNDTIGTNGITNGIIGRTLNDIGIPLVPLEEP